MEIVHILKYELNIEIWFEFVPSELNFVDGVRRNLDSDEFCRRVGSVPFPFDPPSFMWVDPLVEVWERLRAALG